MLLALARESPEVLPLLGISMPMLQKEQENLQNVERLKVGSLKETSVERGSGLWWGKILGDTTVIRLQCASLYQHILAMCITGLVLAVLNNFNSPLITHHL